MSRAAIRWRYLAKVWALCLLALALVCWAYFPGLSGMFVLDDFGNVINNDAIVVHRGTWAEFVAVGRHYLDGPFGRPVTMVSLALDAYFSNSSPWHFKAVNLAIHLLNGACLFMLGRLLLDAHGRVLGRAYPQETILHLSLFVAVAWALHPLALTSVLYVVQRMTSLSSLFMLFGLLAFAWARSKLLGPYRNMSRIARLVLWLSPPILGTLAVLAKEIGVLLPLYIMVVEVGIFRFHCADGAGKRMVLFFHAVYVALPCLIAVLYVVTHLGSLLGYYDVRGYGLAERLFTQPRVLWFYLRLVLAPDMSAMSLYHDDLTISSGVFAPVTTLPALLGLLLLAVGAVWQMYKGRLIGFGIAWFLIGHVLESSILPLEMVFEHRNYLPMYGVLLGCIMAMASVTAGASRFLKVSLLVLPLLYLGGITHLRAATWSNAALHAETEATDHPGSFRANYQAGRLHHRAFDLFKDEGSYRQAGDYYRRAQALAPRHPAPQVELIALEFGAGKSVSSESYTRLIASVASGPLTPDSLKILHFLEQCDAEGPCKLPEGYFSALMDAILANPKVIARQRADVLNLHGQYLIKRSRGYDAALPMLGDAHRLDPGNFSYGRDLVQAEILAGRAREARRDLTDLSVRFNTRNFSQPILDLQTQLNLISPP